VRKILFSLFLVSLLWSCAPTSRIILTPEQIRLHREIIHQIQTRLNKIQTLSGVARVIIRTSEGTYSAEEFIRLKRPDALRLETWNPMGGLQILLVARGEQGTVVIPGEGRIYHISTEREYLKRFVGVDLTVADLYTLLTGTPPLSSAEPERIQTRQENGRTLVQILKGTRIIQKIWIDNNGRVLGWERLNTQGEPVETIVFDEFREVEGIFMPHLITFSESGGSEFVLRYRSLLLNQTIDDHLFEVPDLKQTSIHHE